MAKDEKAHELVQTRVTKKARELLSVRAEESAISEAAWVRRLIYKELGLMKEEN